MTGKKHSKERFTISQSHAAEWLDISDDTLSKAYPYTRIKLTERTVHFYVDELKKWVSEKAFDKDGNPIEPKDERPLTDWIEKLKEKAA